MRDVRGNPLRMDLTGKRVVVTGATAGIGRELARVFASKGAKVGLAVRDVAKGEALQRELGGQLEVLPCDFASMASVRGLAEQIAPEVLMLNAGVSGLPFALTAEGHERTYAANYLGHFLLVHRLLERKAFPPGARIVVTQSTAVTGPLGSANLEMVRAPSEKAFSKLKAGPNTKVLLGLMARVLAQRGGPLVVGVSPGGVQTSNLEQTPSLLRPLVRALLAPVEVGVEPILWAASAEGLVSGAVYGRKHAPLKLNKATADLALAEQAWRETEKVLGLPAWP